MQILSFQKKDIQKVFAGLAKGKIAVIPTDTLYGIVGQALNKKTVERIYKLRKRNPSKPFIVLIASYADLKKLGAKITVQQKKILKKLWPGPVSVILSCPSKNMTYLHRVTNTLALRMHANHGLCR
jgi:L-threonylcarbamoyladenylate synthase